MVASIWCCFDKYPLLEQLGIVFLAILGVYLLVSLLLASIAFAIKVYLFRNGYSFTSNGSYRLNLSPKVGDTYGSPSHPVETIDPEKDRLFEWLPKFLDVWWMFNNAHRDYDSWFRPNDSHIKRKFFFALRNPFHNFFYFIIGVNHRMFYRYGISPRGVWNESGKGWNLAFIKLINGRIGWPFVSYIKEGFQFYIGWRERGNFGVALRFK